MVTKLIFHVKSKISLQDHVIPDLIGNDMIINTICSKAIALPVWGGLILREGSREVTSLAESRDSVSCKIWGKAQIYFIISELLPDSPVYATVPPT